MNAERIEGLITFLLDHAAQFTFKGHFKEFDDLLLILREKAASLAGQPAAPASPASPDIRPAGYNRPLSGPEVITGQPVSREWLRWQAGEIWSAKTIDDAMDTLADTIKGFGANVEEEK